MRAVDIADRRQAALDLLVHYVRVVDDPRRVDEWPDVFTDQAELQESGQASLGAHVMVWGTGQIGGAPLLLAVGEYRDIVVFSDGVARFKVKTVILDNPVLQDVFVYPL